MIIATVDAINADGTLTDHPVSVRQIALVDCILVTKLDLLPPDEREARKAALVARLRKYNRTAMIVEQTNFRANPFKPCGNPEANRKRDPSAPRRGTMKRSPSAKDKTMVKRNITMPAEHKDDGNENHNPTTTMKSQSTFT